MNHPRIIISALKGGAGKTIISIGVTASLVADGNKISVFKKGPDYIDAGWLTIAAGWPCYNLDTFIIPPDAAFSSFISRSFPDHISVIEGNRGIHDGIDPAGKTSTAELAKLLSAPVILCLDCTKTTRTMAAVVNGCIRFDPDVQIKGVILNRVAGPRHESIITRSIESYCNVPVLGVLPKIRSGDFPERHMGLVPTQEHVWARKAVDRMATYAKKYLNLSAIRQIAKDASPIKAQKEDEPRRKGPRIRRAGEKNRPRIGILRDSAFQFYYPENLEALESAGAALVYISPFTHHTIPDLHGIYIGGGFPETHAEALAENKKFRESVKTFAEKGGPVYAECGGLVYLGRALAYQGVSYPMADVFPVIFDFKKRPQGHGYTILSVDRENPYYPEGTEIRGHEFHYSRAAEWMGDEADIVCAVKRGVGFLPCRDGYRDGVRYKNVLAFYTHMHALGTSKWADAMVGLARAFQSADEDSSLLPGFTRDKRHA